MAIVILTSGLVGYLLYRAIKHAALRAAEAEYIKKEAAAGRVYAIRPSEPITISGTSRNPDELEYVYQLGRKDALSVLSDIKNFLS